MNETMADERMGPGKGRGVVVNEVVTEGVTEGVSDGSIKRATEQPGSAARLAARPLFMCGFRPFFLATAHYGVLVAQYHAPKLFPPFNEAARKKAGFSDEELAWLLG